MAFAGKFRPGLSGMNQQSPPEPPLLCVGLHGPGWDMSVHAECSGSDMAFPGTAEELSSSALNSREFFTSPGFEAFGDPPGPPWLLAAPGTLLPVRMGAGRDRKSVV